MNRLLVQIAAGWVFGAGLALAGMTLPSRVLGFLDITGNWDPALLFVLGGAVLTAAAGYRWVFGRGRPLFDERFHVAPDGYIDAELLAGSALFGIGWGISGYCPGPAVALLAVPSNAEGGLFLGGLVLGVIAAHFWQHGLPGADDE